MCAEQGRYKPSTQPCEDGWVVVNVVNIALCQKVVSEPDLLGGFRVPFSGKDL